MPSIFLLYLIFSLGVFTQYPIVLAPVALYVFLLGLTAVGIMYQYKNIGLSMITVVGIFFTHVFYGFYFLKGIAARRLEQ